ncbi:prepilin-type N-terminal cleavage/methylation domain-containing protein, partial [Patescibacteria group bacterium]|nr:prepilin-type N-terminal cleavage/methylation domain-containing protein [Patescibacteria group bacterium]
MKIRKNNKEAGFSFAELMVVISITVILATLVFVAYRRGQDNYDLNNAAEKIVAITRQAQNYAKSGVVQVQGEVA